MKFAHIADLHIGKECMIFYVGGSEVYIGSDAGNF